MNKCFFGLILLFSMQINLYGTELNVSLEGKFLKVRPDSVDGHVLEVKKSVFNAFKTLSSMVDETDINSEDVIPVPNISLYHFNLLVSFVDNSQNKFLYDGYDDSLEQGFFVLLDQIKDVKDKYLFLIELAKSADFLDIDVLFDEHLNRKRTCKLSTFFIKKSFKLFLKDGGDFQSSIIAINQNSTLIDLFKKSMQDIIKIQSDFVIDSEKLQSFRYIAPFIKGLHKRLSLQAKKEAFYYTLIELKRAWQDSLGFNVDVNFLLELLKHNESFNIKFDYKLYCSENKNLQFNELILDALIDLMIKENNQELMIHIFEHINYKNLNLLKDLLINKENSYEVRKAMNKFMIKRWIKENSSILLFSLGRISLGLYCLSLK